VFWARAEARSAHPLATRLEGPAFVRLSSALWGMSREWPDALGVAVRFRSTSQITENPDAADQDLLFATIPKPLLTPFSPLWTRVVGFFENVYYGVSPFDIGSQIGYFRLRSEAASVAGRSRAERLRRRVAQGSARFVLDWRPVPAAYAPLVTISLERELGLEQQRLRFSPFRCGRGIEPVGFIHGLRRAAYLASEQASREA
jgi:hypothetical protein